MKKKFLMLWMITCSILVVNAQTFFSEQEENIIYYSPDIANTALCLGDIDGDEDLDILSFFDKKFRLYDHLDGKGTFNELEIISAENDWILSVQLSDLDGDGLQDILAASYNFDKVIWYKNHGGNNFGAAILITDLAKGARSVYAADIDQDGDQDVFSASLWDNKIAWYENTGGGVFGEQQIISTAAGGARYVYVSDLNADGLPDVLSTSVYDNKVAWYENKGGGIFGEQQVITTDASRALCVYTADIDGDGKPDVLSASSWDNKIAWYKNDGQGNFGDQQVISTALDDAQCVYAADMDQDGDQDVLSASLLDNKLAWYENKGGGEFGTQQVVSNNADGPGFIYATDINGDGYMDIVSASTDFKIAWYENTLPLKIIHHPNDTTIYQNHNAIFSILADSAKAYQWQCFIGNVFVDLSNDNIYAGVNTNTLAITDAPFDLNQNEYRCIAINGADSLNSTAALLTLIDTEKPVITSVHSDSIIAASGDDCYAIMPDFSADVVATDNSGASLNITQTPAPSVKISGAVNPVVIRVTDLSNNTSELAFNVEVMDETKPNMACVSNKVVILDQGITAYTVSGTEFDLSYVNDNCAIASIQNNINSAATLNQVEFPLDTTRVVWTVTDEGGNVSECSFDVIVKGSVGIETLQNHGISVYPNPTTGDIFIESISPVQHVQIFDLKGSIVLNKTDMQESGQINIAEFKRGTYILSIVTEKNDYNLKIIKE